MSAELDLLRRASALIRQRADAASGGRWFAVDSAVYTGTAAPHQTLVPCVTYSDDAEHIASWHPDAARGVADWLDNAAEDLAMQSPGGELHHQWDMRVHINAKKALAFARTYLRETDQ